MDHPPSFVKPAALLLAGLILSALAAAAWYGPMFPGMDDGVVPPEPSRWPAVALTALAAAALTFGFRALAIPRPHRVSVSGNQNRAV